MRACRPNNRFERSRADSFDGPWSKVDDADQSASFTGNAYPRRSTSSLGPGIDHAQFHSQNRLYNSRAWLWRWHGGGLAVSPHTSSAKRVGLRDRLHLLRIPMVSPGFRFAFISTQPVLIDGGCWPFGNCNPILSFPNSRVPKRLYRNPGIRFFDAGVHTYGRARAIDRVRGPVLTGGLSDRGL